MFVCLTWLATPTPTGMSVRPTRCKYLATIFALLTVFPVAETCRGVLGKGHHEGTDEGTKELRHEGSEGSRCEGRGYGCDMATTIEVSTMVVVVVVA